LPPHQTHTATFAVAINVSITFMKAGQAGTLWAEAREIARNFKLGSYTVEVKDDQGELSPSSRASPTANQRRSRPNSGTISWHRPILAGTPSM